MGNFVFHIVWHSQKTSTLLVNWIIFPFILFPKLWGEFWCFCGAFFPFLYKQSRNISANWIIFLFSFANTLEALYLNNNRLGILADNAFAQMTNLKELNLADNQLAALPPTLFTTQMNSLESLQVSAGTVDAKSFDFWHHDIQELKTKYTVNMNRKVIGIV